jgi:catechol 2,3-dioxygenase-like lactoylglutathione lyase family enzyme
MKLRLDHYNIRTTKLQATVDFYTSVLGLRSGFRPSTRPGAWLYDRADIPVVHLSGIDTADPQAMKELEAHLGAKDISTLEGSGSIDHVAFEGPDFTGAREHLVKLGVPFTERDVPQLNLKQLFVTDPNGVTVELNFRES